MEETEDSTFETMEIDTQEVLKEFSGDGRFRVEYEKVANALQKSHKNEKRLMAKCMELNAELMSTSVKLSTAMKLSDEDQTTISTLKMEIDKAWKMVEASHKKELQAKESILKLKEEITNLQNLVGKGAGVFEGQEYSMGDLLKNIEELTNERDKLLSEVVTLRENLTKATDAAQQEIEAEKNKAMDMIAQLQQDIQVRQNELQRETRRKEKLEKEVKQLQTDLESKQSEIKSLTQQSQHLQDDQQKLEQQLQESKIINEKTSKEMEQLQHRNTKLQQDNEQNSISLEQLSLQIQQQASDLKIKEEIATQLKQEISKLTKLREGVQRRLQLTQEQKVEVENQRETLRNQIIGLKREMEVSKNQTDMDKKAIDELVREKGILNKNMIKAANETDKQQNYVKQYEQSMKSLENEILNYRDEAQKQRKIIFQLEKERDHHINEASELKKKVFENMEENKLKQIKIFEEEKRIAEVETKLKQQKNLYEDVRTERDLFSKNLIEAKDDLQKMKQQAQETKQSNEKLEAEERELLKIIAKADVERIRQKKELDQVICERDLLGTQLVKRNDELKLLYEKIKIQESIINKGHLHYNEKVEDIRLLKLEIKKQRREKNILNKTASNVEDLRQEVFHMQRELLKERTRCRALEDELKNPMNVHHWRKISETDPSTFELIQKIHCLQRRLIAKTQEVVEKSLLLQEKDKLYVELKHILARQPGPEAAEKLQVYQRTLREKTKQLKALTAELNMRESQVEDYKYEIERLAQELQEVKKKYLAQKRKEQEYREKERNLSATGQPAIQPQRPDGPRFAGGGFSFKQHNRMTLQALEQQS
ncbi:cilia- and flagella-associated protein 58 [Pimephales promelas]|uniref:cilia- and flagella-associated protein 58 n=1 Tax=Pimephales promelas TaxID=90988 RepID=UPI001955979E|nr:cilia- and flagella-associated protein 58 [Pimephales promelas]